MIIYVNSDGAASFVGCSVAPISVGPVMSLIDGVRHITAHLSLDQIKDLRQPVYQQLQITN